MPEYSDEELLQRLRRFDSDSAYEVGLVHGAADRIEQLLSKLRDAEQERQEILDYYPFRSD